MDHTAARTGNRFGVKTSEQTSEQCRLPHTIKQETKKNSRHEQVCANKIERERERETGNERERNK